MEFANTVLRQLGGSKFVAMTAARDLCYDDTSVMFRIGRNPKGVVKLTINLDPSDTYTVKAWNKTWDEIDSASDVYCDQLSDIVAEMTGLRLSL